MSEAGERMLEGAREALAVAKGDKPAARVTINGHAYVPESRLRAVEDALKELLHQHVSVEHGWHTAEALEANNWRWPEDGPSHFSLYTLSALKALEP